MQNCEQQKTEENIVPPMQTKEAALATNTDGYIAKQVSTIIYSSFVLIRQQIQASNLQEQLLNKQWNKSKYISFLKVNKWKIESLVDWEEWNLLTKEQQNELEELCIQEQVLKAAKNWLKSDKSHQINDIVLQEQFACLQQNKKFKEWVKNKNYYQKKRNLKSHIDTNENNSTIFSQNTLIEQINELKQISIFEQPLTSLTSKDNDLAEENFRNLAQEKWNQLIKNCEKCNYKERLNLFQAFYFKDPLIFIQLLKNNSKEKTIDNIFSIVQTIIYQLDISHEKTNLLAASLRYYNFEIFRDAQYILVLKNTITQLIKKLQMEIQTEEVLGFFHFIFVNNFQLSEEQLNEISLLCLQGAQAWKTFIQQIQNYPFNLRHEIAERLPKSGLIFRQSLIQILKETKGEIFLRVTEEYRKILIEIIVYSGDNNLENLRDFIEKISDYIQGYGFILEKAKFLLFLLGLIDELKIRSMIWFQNLKKVEEYVFKIIQGIIDKKIIDIQTLIPCLKGDFSCLYNELSKTKVIVSGGIEEIQNILKSFKKMNQDDQEVQNYQISEFNDATQKLYTQIEREFGREFHNLQTFCIKYALNVLGKGKYLFQFGLGNGKTLISSALSILICFILQQPVIIVVKSQYLLQRDFNKFKGLIYSCGLQASIQAFNYKGITFMDDCSFFKKFKKNNSKNQVTQKEDNIFVIIDEYDTIFDENKPQNIVDKLMVLNQFNNLIGFTGSPLSKEQNQCILESLSAKVISFPIMNEILGSNLYQRRSLVYMRQTEWLENLSNIVHSTIIDVPVILALHQQDIAKVKEKFKQDLINNFDLSYLLKKQSLAELQTLIECQFNQRLQDNTYGVYIINQEIGRGTDFPSSEEIENNGGIYLILGDIFGFRQSAQIKGRVGRMQNKGQFQYILNMKDSGNVQDYISQRQNILYINEQRNTEILLNQIRSHNEVKKDIISHQSILEYRQCFFNLQELVKQTSNNEEQKLNGQFDFKNIQLSEVDLLEQLGQFKSKSLEDNCLEDSLNDNADKELDSIYSQTHIKNQLQKRKSKVNIEVLEQQILNQQIEKFNKICSMNNGQQSQHFEDKLLTNNEQSCERTLFQKK